MASAQTNPPVHAVAAYLLPGMSIEMRIPVISTRPSGYFAATKEMINLDKQFGADNNAGPFTDGFVVEDKRVGELTKGTEGAVIYTHKKAQKNSIWFFAYSGERGVLNIVSVPIHDHSSIVQGGPAYGTYFSDDEEKSATTT
jgi:hypothetical protein